MPIPLPPVNDLLFLHIDEIFNGRRGSPYSADMKREYVRRFRALVRHNVTEPVRVTQYKHLPKLFDPYVNSLGTEMDLASLCVKITPEQEHADDWTSWIITYDYSTEMPEGGPRMNVNEPGMRTGVQNCPWEEPPHIEWESQETQKTMVKDLDGKPFLNSAYQPFSPAPTFESAYPILVIKRNFANVDQDFINKYAYAVNEKEFMKTPPGCAQCLPIRAVLDWRGKISFYRTVVRIRFSNEWVSDTERKTWQAQILDSGLCELQKVLGVPFSKEPVPIIRHGLPISQPVCLDGSGSVKKPSGTGLIQPYYLNFRVYRKVDLAALISPGPIP